MNVTMVVRVQAEIHEYDAAQARLFIEDAMYHFFRVYDERANVTIAVTRPHKETHEQEKG